MIGKYYTDVRQFHKKFSLPVNDASQPMSDEDIQFRNGFLSEEFNEFVESEDLFKMVDALVDMGYVALGTMLYMGIKPDPKDYLRAFKAVTGKIHVHQWVGWTVDRKNSTIGQLVQECNSAVASRDQETALETLSAIVMFCELWCTALDIPYHKCWMEVHRANMDKLPATPERPSSRGKTSGDMIKPEGWKEPDFSKIIAYKVA